MNVNNHEKTFEHLTTESLFLEYVKAKQSQNGTSFLMIRYYLYKFHQQLMLATKSNAKKWLRFYTIINTTVLY